MIRPLNDRVIIEKHEDADKTKGGIYLPDAARQKQYLGKIVACGPGRMLDSGERAPMEVKVGDTVLYHSRQVMEIKVGEKDYLVTDEREILARV